MFRNGKRKNIQFTFKPFKWDITFFSEGKMSFECNKYAELHLARNNMLNQNIEQNVS